MQVVNRELTWRSNAKLREILHEDFTDFSAIEGQLAGHDACFFCLGISASGMTEEAYHRITYDFTLAAAEALARVSPEMTFIYVSGAGTDSTERGRWMWARVKGITTEDVGRAMLQVAKHGAGERVLENRALGALSHAEFLAA